MTHRGLVLRGGAITSCVVLTVSGTVAAYGVSAPGAAPAVATVLAGALRDLGPVGSIDGATVQAASPDDLRRAGAAGGQWITLHSSAIGYIPQLRARWIAGVIISQVWRACLDRCDTAVVGGRLVPMPADEVSDGSGMSLVITPALQEVMFTSRDGVTPSKLKIPDEAEYRHGIEEAAVAAGLTVDDVVFTRGLGTVVQIDESVGDAAGFLRRYGRTNPGLTLDPSEVEGVMLVVRDSWGDVVMTSAWATGSQSGEGGPGPARSRLR